MSYRKIIATTLSTNFREACKVVQAEFQSLGDAEVLVRNRFVGINATDINVAAGRYSPSQKPPLETGLEGVGTIVQVGKSLPPELKGKAVGYIYNGAFSEYIKLPAKITLPIPEEKAIYVPLLISGLTAAMALEKLGELKPKETVLITAAAGGTGHLAVQLAKNAGCHVIGLCSSDDKSVFLKSLGCDRVINYKEEDFSKVLREEYPRGIDVAYESIGGNVFETCLNRLAIGGRIISLGFISSYHSPGGVDRNVKHATIVQKLLLKSASVRGFFLMNHAKHYGEYLAKLVELVNQGKLKPHLDDAQFGKSAVGLENVFDAVDLLLKSASVRGFFLMNHAKHYGEYLAKLVELVNQGKLKPHLDDAQFGKSAVGLENVFDAVDYLYGRSSLGKIVVDLGKEPTSNL